MKVRVDVVNIINEDATVRILARGNPGYALPKSDGDGVIDAEKVLDEELQCQMDLGSLLAR